MKKRKDGRYCINVYLGTFNGVKKYKSVFGKTEKEVKDKAAELRVQSGQGFNLTDTKSFSVWANRYLAHVEHTAVADWYKTQCARTKIWIDEFDETSVEKILPADCQDVFNNIAKSNPYYPNKQTSYKTLIEYKNVLCRIFDYCIQNRILTFNPASYIVIPKTAKKGKRHAISDEEINAIWNTDHVLRTACLISVFCGLRRGEIAGLTWNDIDLKNNVINVNKAVNPKDNTVKAPKTAAGIRSVPIPDKLRNYLIQCDKKTVLVLDRDGRHFTNNDWLVNWRSYKKKIKEEQGIDIDATFHCLRHTYCTLLYEAGIGTVEAKEFMGHADIQTTLGIYTHLQNTKRNKSVVKLNDYLSPKDNAESEG